VKKLFAPLILFCLCLSSCSSTWVGQSFYYPPGFKPIATNHGDYYTFDDSPALFQVYVGASGALGKSYDDRSEKKSYVRLYRHDVLKGQFEYSLRAGCLNYDITWHAPGDCTLHFYDLPDGIDDYDKGAKEQRKEIGHKHYRYDGQSDSFREVP
jgi:hypothetical protein